MDDLWIGLSSVMVSLRRPYSCLFCKMWSLLTLNHDAQNHEFKIKIQIVCCAVRC